MLGKVLAALGQSRLSSNLNQLARAANVGALMLGPETNEALRAAVEDIAAIRALRGTDRVWPRILVLTTYDTDRDIRASMEAGADGYLLKDARRADLVRAVLDLCAGRPALAPGALAALLGRRGEVDLTPREIEVLSVIAAGGTNRTAAERLLVSEATVKTHLLHAYAKLGVSDRAAAVRVAYERGLL